MTARRDDGRGRTRTAAPALSVFLGLAGCLGVATAEGVPAGVVTVATPAAITASPGTEAKATISVTVAAGYHANSNKPSEDYLIPFSLKWEDGSLRPVSVTYPKAQLRKLTFSNKPLSVFTGSFIIVTRFHLPNNAAPGKVDIKGKLHYQACDDRSCQPPKTLEVSMPVEIVNRSPGSRRAHRCVPRRNA